MTKTERAMTIGAGLATMALSSVGYFFLAQHHVYHPMPDDIWGVIVAATGWLAGIANVFYGIGAK